MDLCTKRYASPFFTLDYWIDEGYLTQFIRDLYRIVNDEKIWELWVHKVDNMGYEEFRAKVNSSATQVDEAELKETFRFSEEILSKVTL